jgi:putative copper resistance protein D
VGGLVVLAPEVLAKPRDAARLIALLKLFSRWGVASVAVLIVSGMLNTVLILDIEMNRNSSYVTWLAIKITLAATMVALALSNKFNVLPGLERGDREAALTIPLTVLAELAGAMAVLLIVGFLGAIAPMAM